MIELNRSKFGFKIKEIWFADAPYDVEGADIVYFHACKNKKDIHGFNCSEITTLTIDLTQGLETIWHNMSKSSCRYAINKAIRDGVKIKIPAECTPFFKMDTKFRLDKHLPPRNCNIDLLSSVNSVLFVSWIGDNFCYNYGGEQWDGGELLGGQLYIYDNNVMRLTFAASRRLSVYKDMATTIGNANKLIVWEAIKYAKYRGIKTFDFGGYSPLLEHKSVNEFKESFGGLPTQYYNYVKIYSKLLKSLNSIL